MCHDQQGTSICNFFEIWNNKYQELLQHVTAQDKKFAMHFAVTFFQYLNTDFLQPKVCLVTKPCIIYLGAPINTTLGSGAA